MIIAKTILFFDINKSLIFADKMKAFPVKSPGTFLKGKFAEYISQDRKEFIKRCD